MPRLPDCEGGTCPSGALPGAYGRKTGSWSSNPLAGPEHEGETEGWKHKGVCLRCILVREQPCVFAVVKYTARRLKEQPHQTSTEIKWLIASTGAWRPWCPCTPGACFSQLYALVWAAPAPGCSRAPCGVRKFALGGRQYPWRARLIPEARTRVMGDMLTKLTCHVV